MLETKGKFGDYKIIEEIGQGGMGKVYKAYHPHLDKTVAIKVMLHVESNSQKQRDRFFSEAKNTARLTHPNIVNIHDVVMGELDYIVMDFIEGSSLETLLKKTKFSPRKALEIIRDTALAIDYAHKNDIVHRDLKPANIIIETQSKRPIVMDFGISKNIKKQKGLTQTGELLGTLQYMAPEQAEGNLRSISPATDVYSLGAILYEMITGHKIVEGNTQYNLIHNIVNQEVIPPRNINPYIAKDIETICMKALEKEPKRRYQTAQAFAEDIERFLNGEIISARPANLLYRLGKNIQRHKLPIASICTSLLLLFAILLYSFYFAPGQITIEARAEIQGKLSSVFPEIIIDKIPQKKSATLSLPPGNHSILMKLQDKDYEPLEFPIYVPAGQQVKLEKHFVHRKGKVRLSSIVPPVEARFVNQKSGKKFYFLVREQDYAEHTLDVGEYEMTFQKENYFSQTKRVTIREKEVLSFPIHLEPMLLESWTLGEEQETKSISLADVDGNGKLELLCFSPQGSITAYDFWKKARLWHIPYKLPEIAYQAAFHDIDKDGIPDFTLPHHHCFLAISGKTHRELFSLPNYWGWTFAFADANQDGYEDFILMRAYHGIECYDSQTGNQLWQNEQKVGTFCSPVLLNQKNLLYARDGKFLKLDITNGKEDIYLKYSDNASNADDIRIVSLLENKQGILCYSEDEGLLCFDLISGKKLWHWKHHPQNIQAMTLADMDQDGKDEIFIHLEQLYCLDMSTGKVKWRFDTRNPKKLPREIHTEKWETAPLVADLDQDGSFEVVVYTPENKIYILNAQTGAKINEFSTTKSVQSLILFDANHDGQMEILFLAGNQVFCIRHRSEHRIRIFEKNNLSNAALGLADFDDNGTQDIILGNREGEVFILDGQSWQEIWHYKMPDPIEPISHPPIMADVCGDSRKEILIYAQKTIMAVSKEKKILWSFPTEDAGYSKLFFVADVNKDGRKEVIITTNHKGLIYCLNGQTGKILWKNCIDRLYSSPQICDLEGDGYPEIVATTSTFYTNLNYGLFRCLDARDGSLQWSSPISCFSEGQNEITLYDVNNDGILEIFVTQIGGRLSCLDGKTGQACWHQRLRGGDVKCYPAVSDFNRDGKMEVIVTTANDDVHCLDALSGKILWSHVLCENHGSVMDTDLNRHNVALVNLQTDLNEDGFNDLVMLNEKYFFSIFSGKDGRWLGHAQEYNLPKEVPIFYLICDLDQDHLFDFLFVINSRLFCVYDFAGYLKKLLAAPAFAASPSQDVSLLLLSHSHNLFSLRAYDQMEKTLSQIAFSQTRWQHWYYFYQGVCALSQGKESLDLFKKSLSLSPGFLDAQFIQAVRLLNQNQAKESIPFLEFLMQNSPFDFHPLYLKYRCLLTKKGQNELRTLLPSIIKKTECDLKFMYAYAGAFYTNRNEEADYFLELSLRYGLPTTPQHKVRSELYIKKIMTFLKKINNAYCGHEYLFIKDHALEVIPDYASRLDEICKEK